MWYCSAPNSLLVTGLRLNVTRLHEASFLPNMKYASCDVTAMKYISFIFRTDFVAKCSLLRTIFFPLLPMCVLILARLGFCSTKIPEWWHGDVQASGMFEIYIAMNLKNFQSVQGFFSGRNHTQAARLHCSISVSICVRRSWFDCTFRNEIFPMLNKSNLFLEDQLIRSSNQERFFNG